MNPIVQFACKDSRRHGLTLVELLVVLVILAIMTVIAVQSTEYLADQARYDATQRTLSNVQAAVLGPQRSDGTSLSGFLADIGRPPLADANAQLSELWSQGTLPSFQAIYPPATDTKNSDVSVLAGWRGPYLRLPAPTAQGNQLYDGKGNPFNLLGLTLGKVNSGDAVFWMQYAPVVGTLDTYDTALTAQPVTSLSNNPPSAGASLLPTTVTGSIIDPDATSTSGSTVVLKLFFPDFTNTGNLSGATWTLSSAFPKEDPSGTGLPYPYSFTFTPALALKVNGTPLPATGNMVLRAYQTVGATTYKGPIVRIRVPAGGLMQDVRFDLK